MLKWVNKIIDGEEYEVETEMTLEEALRCGVEYAMDLEELNYHLQENGYKEIYLDSWATEDYNNGDSICVDYEFYTLEFDTCGELSAIYDR